MAPTGAPRPSTFDARRHSRPIVRSGVQFLPGALVAQSSCSSFGEDILAGAPSFLWGGEGETETDGEEIHAAAPKLAYWKAEGLKTCTSDKVSAKRNITN